MRSKIYKVINILLPNCFFMLIFIFFIMQIFFRYILNKPLTYSYELIGMSYVWVVLLGGVKVRSLNQGIIFSFISEKIVHKRKNIDIVTKILILFSYIFMVWSGILLIWYNQKQVTYILKWPTTLFNTSFIIYTLGILYYTIIDFYKVLFQNKKEKFI